MQKDVGTAYLFLFFLGAFGAHRFYLGQKGLGILFMLTFGGFGIWWVVDLFTLNEQVKKFNIENSSMREI